MRITLYTQRKRAARMAPRGPSAFRAIEGLVRARPVQLAVIAGAFVLVAYWTSHREWYRRRIVVPASASIALIGVYWTVERLLA